jgi:hypothetical protein
MTRPIAALFAVLATAAAGCGGTGTTPSQDFSGAEEDVAEVVEELQTAAQEDEPARICRDLFSRALTQQLGGGCARVVGQAIDDSDIFEVTADSVRITGTRARVRVDAGRDGERQELYELVNERGDWRIARFAGEIQ